MESISTRRLRTCLVYGITLLHEVYWRGIWKSVSAEVVSLGIRIRYRYVLGIGIGVVYVLVGFG